MARFPQLYLLDLLRLCAQLAQLFRLVHFHL